MTTLDQARRAAFDPRPRVRQEAAVRLGTLGDATLARELVALLVSEDDFFVRETLTWALVRHPEAAVSCLVEALESAPDSRVPVLHALSKIQDPDAVPHILPHAASPDPAVAMKAWWALGRTGTRDAAPALLAHLGCGDEDQQRELSRALEQLGEPAVDGLAAALSHPELAVRRHAAQALVLIGDPGARAAAGALAAAAEQDEREVALAAVEALAALDSPEVEPALEQLRESDDRFRSLTAQWLLADREERRTG